MTVKAHRSIQTQKIISRVYSDRGMLIYSPLDPFNEFIDLTLSHESDMMRDTMNNNVKYSFNPQLCDFNEPCFVYTIEPEDDIKQPINCEGINSPLGIDDFIPLHVATYLSDFYSNTPTRVDLTDTTQLTHPFIPSSILFTHNKDDRYGSIHVGLDTNPGNENAVYEYDLDFNLVNSGHLTKITAYEDSYYKFDMSDKPLNSGQTWEYELPFNVLGDISVFDLLHLSHSGEPTPVPTSEFIFNSGIVTFIPYSGSRPSYDSLYYTNIASSGQPDKYWNGIYGAKFNYTPITEVNNGMATQSYFHRLSSLDNTFLYPNTPKSQEVELIFEDAETINSYTRLFRVSPKFVRPGTDVDVTITYTKKEEIIWADPSIDFSHTITDVLFQSTNNRAVFVMYNDALLYNSEDGYTNVTDNNIEITSLTDIIAKVNPLTLKVVVYYKAQKTTTVTTEASYSYETVNYESDYMLDAKGRVIPYVMIPYTETELIDEDYSYVKFNITTTYDLVGLSYDPYRRCFWSYERNNKFLVIRNPNNLSIQMSYPILNNPNRSNVTVGGSTRKLVDYSIFIGYDFLSLKYHNNNLYLMSTSPALYKVDLMDDYDNLGIKLGSDGQLIDPILEFSEVGIDGATPIDFTFTKTEDILVIDSNSKIYNYKTYFDYAFVDIIENKIYFREKYDSISVYNLVQNGKMRTTDIDKSSITLFNTERYGGENLHEYYDRLDKRMLQLYRDNRGINSSYQGLYNAIAHLFDMDEYHTNQQKFIYLSNLPIDNDPSTGETLTIKVYIDGIEISKLGQHPDNIYDSGESAFIFNDSYKYRSILSTSSEEGFIVWRNYNGLYSNVIEIVNIESFSEVRVEYNFWNNTYQKVSGYTETIDIDDIKTSSPSHSINNISNTHLYNSGIITYEGLVEINEILNDIQQHWGYFQMDNVICGDNSLEERKEINFYNILNSGG